MAIARPFYAEPRFGFIAAGVVLVVGIAAFFLLNQGASAQREVFLAPASSVGDHPFTPPVAPPPPAVKPPPLPSAAASGGGSVGSISGAAPELYGGTRSATSCDKQQMITFLQANPDKERAWAQVEGIAAADVPAYINGLTPVLLRYDTRVTNHGFVNGVANPYQTVLQAGTAVLIDQYGVPRARCYCGNPLTPAIPIQGTPVYQGPPWPGYQPTTVVVVAPAPQPVTNIIIIDIVTNEPFARPVGTTGATDTDAPPNILASPLPSASPGRKTPAPTVQPPVNGDWSITVTGASAAECGTGAQSTPVTVNVSGGTMTLSDPNSSFTMTGPYNPTDGTFAVTGTDTVFDTLGTATMKGTISGTSLQGTLTAEFGSQSCSYQLTGAKQ